MSLGCRPCWERPLGTYVGWNLATTGWYGPNASNGPGSVGQVFAGAGNSGGYLPFWDTQAHRTAAGDPRLSLEERYGTHDGYVCLVTAAANEAVQQRFLLASDATTLISNAAASNVLGPPYTPTSADITLASRCARSRVEFRGDNTGWRIRATCSAIYFGTNV